MLLALLLTGIISASLLNQSMSLNKIVNNHISRKKAEITARAGRLLADNMEIKDKDVKYLLDFNFGKKYNIKIENVDKNSGDKTRFNLKIYGSYLNIEKEIKYFFAIED